MKKFKKIHVALSLILFMGLYVGYKVFMHEDDTKGTIGSYQHHFAIMNKSFKRDVERSAVLYKSFEKYFVNASKVPFFIVIPADDWSLFLDRFTALKEGNEIKQLPDFITEEEVFQRCGEEQIVPYNGNIAQQLVKLCFGSTRIAQNYLMIDSDNYFLKEFNHQSFFENNVAKTITWKLPESFIEGNKKYDVPFGIAPILRKETRIIAHDAHLFMKEFFGSGNSAVYGFVTSPFLFNSDNLFRMKQFIKNKGGYKFSTILRLIPFEMQWYGEYVLKHEKFIPMGGIFRIISFPEECFPEIPDDGAYGYVFQSVIYKKDSQTDNPDIIYKRPSHCDAKIESE